MRRRYYVAMAMVIVMVAVAVVVAIPKAMNATH